MKPDALKQIAIRLDRLARTLEKAGLHMEASEVRSISYDVQILARRAE